MFTTSQQAADARLNARIFAQLALCGALLGAPAGAAVGWYLSPAQNALQGSVAARVVLAGAFPRLVPANALVQRNYIASIAPLTVSTIDSAARTGVAVGTPTGAVGLPLLVASLLAFARREKPKKHNQSATVADFLEH